MAHFLIYIPQEHVAAAQKRDLTMSPLAYVGLPDFAAGAFHLQTADGPDGKGGTLFSWAAGTAQRRMHFNTDEQDWIPAVPCGDEPAERYWCGLWKDSPVTPRDIIRPRTTPGTELPVGQHAWRIPAADLLPAVAAFTPAGTWGTEVVPEFREYWSAVETMRLTLAAGHDEMEIPKLFEFCLQALQVNYRLTREVAQHLQILGTESAPRILRTAIGLSAEPEMAGV